MIYFYYEMNGTSIANSSAFALRLLRNDTQHEKPSHYSLLACIFDIFKKKSENDRYCARSNCRLLVFRDFKLLELFIYLKPVRNTIQPRVLFGLIVIRSAMYVKYELNTGNCSLRDSNHNSSLVWRFLGQRTHKNNNPT